MPARGTLDVLKRGGGRRPHLLVNVFQRHHQRRLGIGRIRAKPPQRPDRLPPDPFAPILHRRDQGGHDLLGRRRADHPQPHRSVGANICVLAVAHRRYQHGDGRLAVADHRQERPAPRDAHGLIGVGRQRLQVLPGRPGLPADRTQHDGGLATVLGRLGLEHVAEIGHGQIAPLHLHQRRNRIPSLRALDPAKRLQQRRRRRLGGRPERAQRHHRPVTDVVILVLDHSGQRLGCSRARRTHVADRQSRIETHVRTLVGQHLDHDRKDRFFGAADLAQRHRRRISQLPVVDLQQLLERPDRIGRRRAHPPQRHNGYLGQFRRRTAQQLHQRLDGPRVGWVQRAQRLGRVSPHKLVLVVDRLDQSGPGLAGRRIDLPERPGGKVTNATVLVFHAPHQRRSRRPGVGADLAQRPRREMPHDPFFVFQRLHQRADGLGRSRAQIAQALSRHATRILVAIFQLDDEALDPLIKDLVATCGRDGDPHADHAQYDPD